MEINIESINDFSRKIIVTYAKEEIRKEFDKHLAEVQQKADINGFRKGKVPKKLLVKRFGESIGHEIVEKLVPKAVNKAIKDNDILPVDPPAKVDYENLNVNDLTGFKFEATFEIMPEINFSSEFIDFEPPPIVLSDQEIDKEKKVLLTNYIDPEYSEEPLSEWDEVQVKFLFDNENDASKNVGLDTKTDNKEEDYNSIQDYSMFRLKLSDHRLYEALLGKKKDDTLEIPANRKVGTNADEEINEGNSKSKTVKILEVKKRKFPESDEEAYKLAKMDSIQEFNEKITNFCKNQKYMKEMMSLVEIFRNNIYPKLDFPIPPIYLEKHVQKELSGKMQKALQDKAKASSTKPEISATDETVDNMKNTVEEGQENHIEAKTDMPSLTTDKIQAESLDQSGGNKTIELTEEEKESVKSELIESTKKNLRIMFLIDYYFAKEKLKIDENEFQMRFFQYLMESGIPQQLLNNEKIISSVRKIVQMTMEEVTVIKFLLGEKFGDEFTQTYKYIPNQ